MNDDKPVTTNLVRPAAGSVWRRVDPEPVPEPEAEVKPARKRTAKAKAEPSAGADLIGLA